MALDSWNFGSSDFGGKSLGGLSSSTFSNIGGAVSDLFTAKGLKTKAAGSRIEAAQYDIAAQYARQNKEFTAASTEIRTIQQQRELTKALGETSADVAASGFAESGSALDLIRESASQGALTQAVLKSQGRMEEAGYEQQAKSYNMMAEASRMAAAADEEAAKGAGWGAALKGAAAGASTGAAFGPWGAGIGAAIGAGLTLFGQ